jgi:hypothetical protein
MTRLLRKTSDNGLVLVTSLFVILPLTTMLGTSIFRSLHNLSLSHFQVARQQAFYLAEAGVADALVQATGQSAATLLALPLQQIALPGGSYTVSYVDDGTAGDDVIVLVSTGRVPVGSSTVTKTIRATIQAAAGGSNLFDYAVVASNLGLAGNAVIGEPFSRVTLSVTGGSSTSTVSGGGGAI